MPINYPQLKTELQTDPQNLGYAASLAVGDCNTLAALINSLTGPGAGTVTLATMSNSDFVLAFLPYLPTALELPAPKGPFYAVIWQTILAMGAIDFSHSTVQGMMAQAISDGVLTSAQATALNQRTGSRAEVLFGAGTGIDFMTIAQALRS